MLATIGEHTMNTISKAILEQLGGNRFVAMTGAKNFVEGNNSLSFRIGRNSTSCNHVEIILDLGTDLYNMIFSRLSMAKGLEKKKEAKGIYSSQLQELFTKATGLYTKL
jgi:hypothetical protein